MLKSGEVEHQDRYITKSPYRQIATSVPATHALLHLRISGTQRRKVLGVSPQSALSRRENWKSAIGNRQFAKQTHRLLVWPLALLFRRFGFRRFGVSAFLADQTKPSESFPLFAPNFFGKHDLEARTSRELPKTAPKTRPLFATFLAKTPGSAEKPEIGNGQSTIGNSWFPRFGVSVFGVSPQSAICKTNPPYPRFQLTRGRFSAFARRKVAPSNPRPNLAQVCSRDRGSA